MLFRSRRGFGGLFRFLIRVWHLHHDFDLVLFDALKDNEGSRLGYGILDHPYIKNAGVSVFLSTCVHMSLWFLNSVKSVLGVWGIIGTGLARAWYILQVHTILCTNSCNFHTISCNFGYFRNFWPISTCWVSKCMYLS